MGTRIVLLVIGTSRSGTTLLDAMLGNADDAFSCGELCPKFRPWRPHHLTPRCVCDASPCPVWERLADAEEQNIHLTIMQRLGVRFVVDSSKETSWAADVHRYCAIGGLGIHNIAVHKKPANLVQSYLKRGRTAEDALRGYVHYYRRFFSLRLPYSAVSYETLVERPEPTLQAILGSVGATAGPSRHEFWKGDHHFLWGSGSVANQVRRRAGCLNHGEGGYADPDVLRTVSKRLRRFTAEIERELLAHDATFADSISVKDAGTRPAQQF